MKIVFIYPRFEKLIESRIELKESGIPMKNLGDFSMPPALGIPTMVALTGDKHEIVLFDQNIEEIDYNIETDLVAISFFTPQAEYAYAIAKEFKQRGKTVIGGGMHPSLMVEEAVEVFDSVCIGEVELVWETMLSDFEKGQLKKTYQKAVKDLSVVPLPARSIFKKHKKYDWSAKLIQTMRGCAYFCENCIIPAEFGRVFRFKTIEQVIQEFTETPINGDYYLIDDTLSLPDDSCDKHRKDIFKALEQLDVKPRLFMSGSLNMSQKTEYIQSLADAGVVSLYCVTGADPYSIKAMQGDKKYIDIGRRMVEKYQSAGIEVYISVGFGFDHQDNSVFDNAMNFIKLAEIKTAEFYIATPFPQTRLWHKLRKEDRILHYNWTKYNTANVVFKPKHMTEQELIDGYIRCWKEFYDEISVSESLRIFEK